MPSEWPESFELSARITSLTPEAVEGAPTRTYVPASRLQEVEAERDHEATMHASAKRWAEAERRRADTYRTQLHALRGALEEAKDFYGRMAILHDEESKEDGDWKTEYKQARDELKERDLVESGAGRGGSLGRREGVKPEEGPSLKKRMEMAREAKAANTKDRRRTTELKEIVRDFMRQQGFSQVDNEHITFAGLDFEKPLIEVWTDSAAQIYTIKPLEWSQLRAKKTS
jgi:hypothetical protein